MVYPLKIFWLYPICRILLRRIKCVENIPNKCPFIIASNHEHLVDPILIIFPIIKKLNKKVHFVATPTWWFLGDVICRKWAGCIPLFDKKQAFEESKALIKSGEIVAIFPEGGTKRTKNPKTGAIRLAIKTKVPILPIGLKSSYLPFNSTINIGKPVHLKKKNNIKKQAIELMEYIYKLKNE